MEDKIFPLIYWAVDQMRESFGGTEVNIISTEMERTEPTEFAKAGVCGFRCEIEGIKTFIPYSACEDMTAYGQHIADELVFMTIKAAHPELFNNE